MKDWENRKLVEASLGDYVHAHMMTQGWGRERIFIGRYFDTQPYISIEEHVGPYQHNLAQVIMPDFFKSKGFTKTIECNPDNGDEQAAGFEEIEIDYKKTVRGYADAAIGYTAPDGSKLLVVIARHDHNDIFYRVMGSDKWAGILKEWFTEATKSNFYKGKKLTASLAFLDLQNHTWDDVILPSNLIKLLKTMISGAIAKAPIYQKNKLSLKRGIMLSGKPGNGKTSAIKVIAKEAPTTVLYAQPSNLMSAKDVRGVCSMARDLAPCILIIEDIDWIAEDRDTGDAGRVIELMNQLDGVEEFNNVITIATTNDVEKIEKAVKNRPGRFDRVITIDNPDEDCRHRMLKLFTKDWILEDVDEEKIVKFSEGLSGAHMHDLCITAAVKAIDSGSLTDDEMVIVKDCHFDHAIKEVKDKDFSSYLKEKSVGKKKGMGFNRYDDFDDEL